MGSTAVGRMVTGASTVKKWEVQPLSAMAMLFVGFVGSAESRAVGVVVVVLIWLLAVGFGGPVCQVAAGGRGARRLRGVFIVTLLDPPAGFLKVAVATCPSARVVQLALVWFLLKPNPCVQQ